MKREKVRKKEVQNIQPRRHKATEKIKFWSTATVFLCKGKEMRKVKIEMKNYKCHPEWLLQQLYRRIDLMKINLQQTDCIKSQKNLLRNPCFVTKIIGGKVPKLCKYASSRMTCHGVASEAGCTPLFSTFRFC